AGIEAQRGSVEFDRLAADDPGLAELADTIPDGCFRGADLASDLVQRLAGVTLQFGHDPAIRRVNSDRSPGVILGHVLLRFRRASSPLPRNESPRMALIPMAERGTSAIRLLWHAADAALPAIMIFCLTTFWRAKRLAATDNMARYLSFPAPAR